MNTQTRSFKEFLRDITVKPLILFPLIGLAHILGLVWIIWGIRQQPINSVEWLQALWMLGYTVFWIAACDYRKWGALGYILLTVLDIALFLFLTDINQREFFTSPMMLFLDGIFSFFLLLFYKRFR